MGDGGALFRSARGVFAALVLAIAVVIALPSAAQAGTASVSGTVRDGAGQVPPGFTGATICPGTEIPPGTPPPPPCQTVFTADYEFTGLDAGTYTVTGFGGAGSALVSAGTPTTLTLAEAEVATVDFVLDSRIQGHVTDPNGDPVEGATVTLLQGGPTIIGGSVATTDANGDYLTPYLGSTAILGSYSVRITLPGPFLGTGSVAVNAGQTATLDVQLALASSISGTVLDGAGQVPPSSTGALVCPGTSISSLGPPCEFAFSSSIPTPGSYEIVLAPDTYTVGGFGGAGTAVVGAGTPQTFNLAPGDTVTANFVLGSRFQGHVTDGNGDPVPGATVSLAGGGPTAFGGDVATTDANGDYLTPYLGSTDVVGPYVVRFTAPGDLVAVGTVDVGPGATATLDTQLGPAATIQGTVAAPLDIAAICPGSSGGSPGCPGLQFNGDGAGNFTITGVAPGTYQVTGVDLGTDPFGFSPTVVIDVAAGDVVDCFFTLDSGSCNGPGSATSTAENADAGGTVSTDSEGTGATETDPLQAAVTTPNAGLVSIQVDDTSGAPPTGFQLLGEQITIEAPDATVEDPLVFVFRIDASLLPEGVDHTNVEVFKDGSATPVPACDGAIGQAVPDPCVSDRQSVDGDAVITVLSSTASVWTFGVADYAFGGFFAPVNNPPTVNTVNAGRAIPVKFSLGGDQGMDIFAEGSPVSRSINCDTQAPTDSIEETADSAGDSGLTYDAEADQYVFVWQTSSNWEGACRQLVVTLADGSVHTANFEFQ